ncbi:DUF2971 domain-containing protein [Paraburkholderia youngii]|uniref:DUF2971 domain-containing protein n=1 Tax=Paraburkholderia youngii TaxID=2782701 RepID=UPI003D1D07A3
MSHFLYKYVSVHSGDLIDRALAILEGRLYFASPLRFNDPFEMSATFANPNEEAVRKRAAESHPLFDVLRRKDQQAIVNGALRAIRGQARRLMTDDLLGRLGVLCLGEDHKNLLMWSHYADSHRGLCIGFRRNASPFNLSRKVLYSSVRPVIPFDVEGVADDDSIEKALLTKSPEWSYEKEWRIIKRKVGIGEIEYYRQRYSDDPQLGDEIADVLSTQDGPGLYEFDGSAIAKIYFGARAPNQLKEMICDSVKRKRLMIEMYQMELDSKYFGLTTKIIN